MIVANITKEKNICNQLRIADTFFMRLKGLLGVKVMQEDEGLLIIPCRSVHTIGMRFAIDVVFIAEDRRVVGIMEALEPNRLSKYHKSGKMVLELQAGRVKHTGLQIGDLISIIE